VSSLDYLACTGSVSGGMASLSLEKKPGKTAAVAMHYRITVVGWKHFS